MTGESTAETDHENGNSNRIKTEVIDPDAPVRFVRLSVDGEEAAMIPWDEARAIAETVEQYPDKDSDSDD